MYGEDLDQVNLVGYTAWQHDSELLHCFCHEVTAVLSNGKDISNYLDKEFSLYLKILHDFVTNSMNLFKNFHIVTV